MIHGVVTSRRPLVRLVIRPPGGVDFEVEAILDTGFTGELALPPPVVAALALPFVFSMPNRLADGSRMIVPVHSTWVRWQGAERVVDVLSLGEEPLLGMGLLDGSDVHLEAIEGGTVTIVPL